MKKISTTLLALLLYGFAYSQGCIPVRNLVGFGQFIRPQYDSLNGEPSTGLTLELNTFYSIARKVSLYGNLFYLFNPRDQNCVSNMYGTLPDSATLNSGATINSVPDAFTARLGGDFAHKTFVFWGGFRMEGQPVHDVFGESNGQRRAGMILSVEPGLNYSMRKMTLYTFMPVPIYRTTYQTVPDKTLNRQSPGGFANYSIFVGALFKL